MLPIVENWVGATLVPRTVAALSSPASSGVLHRDDRATRELRLSTQSARRHFAAGWLDDAEPLTLLPTDLAERDPVLAELAMAAVSGLPPAGPEWRERPPLRLTRNPGASLAGPLCATDMGFTLHAATVARRDDVAGFKAARKRP